MSYAPPYEPTTSFADDESNQASGRSTVRTTSLDVELANIAASVNETIANQKKIVRDDDKLRDLLVEPYALSEQTRAMFAGVGRTPKGAWTINTDYIVSDLVQRNGRAYICQTAHNSGPSFNAGFWLAISGDGSAATSAEAAAASASAAATSATTASSAATTASSAATSATASATSATASALAAQNSADSVAALTPVNLSDDMQDMLDSASFAEARAALDVPSVADLASTASATKGPAIVGFNPDLAYAAATVGGKLLQRRNLRDCGLVADGNFATGAGTDNSAALQAAIDALAQDGGGVLVDDGGIYKLSSQVVWPDGVSFMGAGKWSTIFFAPTAFADTGGLFRVSGVNGYPTCLRGFSLLGQTGGSGGAGLVSVKNGVFLDDVWVSAFISGAGITLSNTDNFLSNFAIELCLNGLSITECGINVQHGTLYGNGQGAVIANSASVEASRVHLTAVRAVECTSSGIVVSAGKQVTLTGCSAAHVNAGKFSTAGLLIDTSSDVIVDGFSGKLGSTPSTTADGIRVVSSTGIVINGGQRVGWRDGINSTGSDVVITGGEDRGNGRNGRLLISGSKVSSVGGDCSGNALAGAGSGIDSRNSSASAIHTLIGNTCTQTGGGSQEYGIYADLTSNGANTGATLIVGNVCRYNATADISLNNAVGGIRLAQNTADAVAETAASVASAAGITLPTGADVVFVTGTTGITSITATGCARRTVTLVFMDALTVTDGSNLKLAGNFVTSADDTLTLYSDGTNWFEVSRSAN